MAYIYTNIFAEKMWQLLHLICKSYSYFFSKNTCESDIVLTRTVNALTTNELVKLRRFEQLGPEVLLYKEYICWVCFTKWSPLTQNVFGKQCISRSDAAECGIWSGSTMFTVKAWISIKHSYNNKELHWSLCHTCLLKCKNKQQKRELSSLFSSVR